MKFEDYVVWQIAKDDTLSKRINDSYVDALKENIIQRRSLIIHFITISAGIIGFTIPVIGSSTLIKNQTILILGLFVLLVLIMYGFNYLRSIIDKENNEVILLYEEFTGYHRKQTIARNEYFKDPTKENFEAWQVVNKEVITNIEKRQNNKQSRLDYSLDIIFFLFLFALTLIVGSLIDFNPKYVIKNQFFHRKKILQQKYAIPTNKPTLLFPSKKR